MSRRGNVVRGLVLAAAGLAVAGCASMSWNKAGATDEQLSQDLAACQEQANAAVETRYGTQIQNRSGGALDNPYDNQSMGAGQSFDAMMLRNQAVRTNNRMVSDCMTARGYTWGRAKPSKPGN